MKYKFQDPELERMAQIASELEAEMAGVTPRYQTGGVTFPLSANASVVGGLMVESDGGSPAGVQPASAGSKLCIGVALNDAVGASVSQTPTVPGTTSPAVNLSILQSYVTVETEGVFPVRYVATAAFGAFMKCAASGQVTPWVDGTDDPVMIVGKCYEVAGVTVSSGYVIGAMRLMNLG